MAHRQIISQSIDRERKIVRVRLACSCGAVIAERCVDLANLTRDEVIHMSDEYGEADGEAYAAHVLAARNAEGN